MPSGSIYALREVQIGKEATPGTAVPATKQLWAEADVKPNIPLYRSQTPFGVLAKNAGPTPTLSKGVDIGLKFPQVTYEQIAWPLAMGLDTPASTGAPTTYFHTFDPGVAALWAPTSMTIEGRWTDGTTPEDLEFEYC